jgi:AcrR family transcriptional regulator
MAGKYTKQELKEMLHRSTFQVVAASGIESVTVRSVAKGCGLSDPFIYQCYSDLRELMTDAFLKIDKEVADLIGEAVKLQLAAGVKDIEQICWVLWSIYWRFLLDDRDKVVFYWRFYQSGYYNPEILQQRQKNFRTFTAFMNAAGKDTKLDQLANIDAIVSTIIDSTVSSAVKIHLGYMKAEDIPPQAIYASVFAYLLHLLGVNVWEINRQEHERGSGA